jgi:hypothetical protein
MILDPEANPFGNPGFAVDMKRAGREPIYGKLHARRAKRFFSNSFPVYRQCTDPCSANQKKPDGTNLAGCKMLMWSADLSSLPNSGIKSQSQ